MSKRAASRAGAVPSWVTLSCLLVLAISTLSQVALAARAQPHPHHDGRRGNSATLLEDGRILLAGGFSAGASTRSSEVFDPESQLFTLGGEMQFPRQGQRALRLADGRVLVVGGLDVSAARSGATVEDSPEIWDPRTETWNLLSTVVFRADDHVAFNLVNDREVLFVSAHIAPEVPSTRADYQPYRAWRWQLDDDQVREIPVKVPPLHGVNLTVGTDGRVLFVGQRLAFHPELRCEEVPAEVARAAGEPSGDWCASHGRWWADADSGQSLLWDSASGESGSERALPADRLSLRGPWLSQSLRNGDALLYRWHTRMPSHELTTEGLLWSAQEEQWRALAFPSAGGTLWPLAELKDGEVAGYDHWLSADRERWISAEAPPQHESKLLTLPSGELAAVSMSEPYWSLWNASTQQWQVLANRYQAVNFPKSLALADGRLAVWGSAYRSGRFQTLLQVWDRSKARWSQLEFATVKVLTQIQAVQLGDGEVLRVGVDADGALECQRWSPTRADVSECGRIVLAALKPDPKYINPQSVPPRYNFALDMLDDGRAALVLGPHQARLYSPQDNRWEAVDLVSTGQPLVTGAPIKLQHPLYRFAHPDGVGWTDISAAVMRFRLSEPQAYTHDMLWDSSRGQWSYILPYSHARAMGSEVARLPDGCVISWHGGERFRLFDPSSGEVRDLIRPDLKILSGSLAVLADGTVSVAAGGSGIGAEQSFFEAQASCAGFADSRAPQARPTAPPPAQAAPISDRATAGEPPSSRDTASNPAVRAKAWLQSHGYLLLAVLVLLLAYFFLRWVLAKLRRFDRTLSLPHWLGMVLRLLIVVAVLQFLVGPFLATHWRFWSESEEGSSHCLPPAGGPAQPDEPLYTRSGSCTLLRGDLQRPCRLTGYWSAVDPQAGEGQQFRYFFQDNGYYEIWPLTDGVAGASIRSGYWATRGKELLWLDPRNPHQAEISQIVSEIGVMTLRGADGGYLEFFKKAPGMASKACNP